MAKFLIRFSKWAQLVVPVVVVVCICIWWLICGTQTTILLLRHADRLGTQDLLSGAGQTRAQELAHVAQKTGIAAIYHSEANRTLQTALPLANALQLTPVQIPANDVQGLVDDIFANHRTDTVLVVGHSNTVPDIITAFGGPMMDDIPHGEYDNLFVLTVCRCSWHQPKLINLEYGAASP